MTQKKRLILTLSLIALACIAPAAASDANQQAVDDAVEAAEAWLALVDSGNYAESWQESAALFRNAVTLDQWKQALSASRSPLGNLVSRKVQTTQYATTLPGAPDGEYVVIQFTTSFSNKASAVETVTPMKDSDGSWRVSGYYIK